MSWRITTVEPKPRLGGVIVTVAGEIADEHGELRFTAASTVLVTADP